ncbi:hypothetical protein F7725_002178, partial [Dissostichus mawsoni]
MRLGEFPLQFPSAEPTLGKESHARKIYVDVSNENTTTPLPRLTIFVKQQCVHSFSLSLVQLLATLGQIKDKHAETKPAVRIREGEERETGRPREEAWKKRRGKEKQLNLGWDAMTGLCWSCDCCMS